MCWNFQLSISKNGESPPLSIFVFPIWYPLLERMFLVFHYTINLLCIEHTTKRDVSSSLLEATNPLMPIVQKFNVTLPFTSIGGKYTRVFDTRLRMGQPHQLYVQSTKWLLPTKSRWPKSLQLIWCFYIKIFYRSESVVRLHTVDDVLKLAFQ